MNKVIKNFLITVVLAISIIFLKNTICLGYNYENPENNFKEFENIKYQTEYNLYLGEKMYTVDNWLLSWYLKPVIKIENLGIVGIEDNTELKAKKIGSTNVTVTATYNGKTLTKSFKINVVKTKENTKLESKTNDVVSITQSADAKNQVLLANSELWNAKDKTYKLTTKKTGNVAKYVYASVYENRYDYVSQNIARVESVLKKDGNLTIKYPKTTKVKHIYEENGVTDVYYTYDVTKTIKTKKVSNIKEISQFGYLTNNGKFYFYDINKNGQIENVLRLNNVKNMLTDYILTKKGKTYALSGKKICNFEAIEADKDVSQCGFGLLLDKKGNLYYYYYDYGYGLDSNNKYTKIRKEQYIVKKVDKNVKSIIGNGKYKTKNGKIKKYKFYAAEENTSVLKEVYLSNKGADNRVSLKENNKVYLNDVYIINNVDDINYTSGTKNSSALIIRKDGSIWRLDIGGKSPKLTKVRSGKDKYKKISKPTNLKATQSGKNNAKVKWSKVEGATKYTVYRSTIKNGKYKKIGTSKTNSYKDTKLKKGQKYYYKVVANYSDSKYNSDMSSSVNVKISK